MIENTYTGRSVYREKALQLKGPYCHICASTDSVEVHHIARDMVAGSHHVHALLPVCTNCHNKITNRSDDFPYERWSELATEMRLPDGHPNEKADQRETIVEELREVGLRERDYQPMDTEVDTKWEHDAFLHGVRVGKALARAEMTYPEALLQCPGVDANSGGGDD